MNSVASRSDSRVFFPWERKRGVLGALGRARAKMVLTAISVVVVIVFVHRREEHAAGVRDTRAKITIAGRAIASYRADHAGKCPESFTELTNGGYAQDPPIDAWGHQLRFVCPGRRDPQGFDVSSDGPDGLPGGLDRVE
jgi:general secretion pathway protein G